MSKPKRHPVQFDCPTLWELINKAALIEGQKQNRVIAPCDYIRSIVEKSSQRVVKKAENNDK